MSAHANPVFAGMGTTIFSVMSALAVEHRAINLGQGFPDEDGPAAIREAAARALIDGPNQYPPTRGLPALRRAIAAHAKRFYDLSFDPGEPERYRTDVPQAEIHILDAGHFALDTKADEIAALLRRFLEGQN